MATASFSSVPVALTPGLGIAGRELDCQLRWYALRVRSRHEKVVNEQLEKQGVESFLPLVKRTQRWTDRTKVIEWPVFSGYSFVRLVLASSDRLQVLKTHGVTGFVGVRNAPTPIPEDQIEGVRTVLSSGVPFEERMFLRVGQRVRIRTGSLAGVEGILCSYDKHQSLVVSVELIQRSISVQLKGYAVEAA